VASFSIFPVQICFSSVESSWRVFSESCNISDANNEDEVPAFSSLIFFCFLRPVLNGSLPVVLFSSSRVSPMLVKVRGRNVPRPPSLEILPPASDASFFCRLPLLRSSDARVCLLCSQDPAAFSDFPILGFLRLGPFTRHFYEFS